MENSYRDELRAQRGGPESEKRRFRKAGKNLVYQYPDGNEVVFVMFLFEVKIDASGLLLDDGKTLDFQDENNESLTLQFFEENSIDIKQISIVQRPVFEDIRGVNNNFLRE